MGVLKSEQSLSLVKKLPTHNKDGLRFVVVFRRLSANCDFVTMAVKAPGDRLQ